MNNNPTAGAFDSDQTQKRCERDQLIPEQCVVV